MCNLSTGVYNKGYDSGISAGEMKKAKATTYRLQAKGMSCEEIADMVDVDIDTVREWFSTSDKNFGKK